MFNSCRIIETNLGTISYLQWLCDSLLFSLVSLCFSRFQSYTTKFLVHSNRVSQHRTCLFQQNHRKKPWDYFIFTMIVWLFTLFSCFPRFCCSQSKTVLLDVHSDCVSQHGTCLFHQYHRKKPCDYFIFTMTMWLFVYFSCFPLFLLFPVLYYEIPGPQ